MNTRRSTRTAPPPPPEEPNTVTSDQVALPTSLSNSVANSNNDLLLEPEVSVHDGALEISTGSAQIEEEEEETVTPKQQQHAREEEREVQMDVIVIPTTTDGGEELLLGEGVEEEDVTMEEGEGSLDELEEILEAAVEMKDMDGVLVPREELERGVGELENIEEAEIVEEEEELMEIVEAEDAEDLEELEDRKDLLDLQKLQRLQDLNEVLEQAELDEEDEDDEEAGEEEEDEDSEDSDSEESEDEEDIERRAIQYEIQSLLETVPIISEQYKLIDRLGEGQFLRLHLYSAAFLCFHRAGTFSSVYKAIDLHHAKYENTLWATPLSLIPVDPTSKKLVLEKAYKTPQLLQLRQQQKAGKVFVALKRIYVTSSPVRIFNELDILNDLRQVCPASFLEGSHGLSKFDQQRSEQCRLPYFRDSLRRSSDRRHAFQPPPRFPSSSNQPNLFPFFPTYLLRSLLHQTYYRQATLPLLRSYFACLFRALSSTHKLAIIHRDVKPANFLFDTVTGTGVLCDYGLAQKTGGTECYEWKAECCHSLPGPSWGGRRGREKAAKKLETLPPGAAPGLAAGLHGVRLIRPVALLDQVVEMEMEWRQRKEFLGKKGRPITKEEIERLNGLKPWMMPSHYREDMERKCREKASWYKNWSPANVVGALNPAKKGVGYLMQDPR